MKDQLVVVTGAGGFIAGALVADLRRQGFRKIRAVDIKPLEQWYQKLRRRREPLARPERQEHCRSSHRGRRPGLQPRRQHGRHGLHRKQQSALHALRPHQHPHADGRPQVSASSASSTPLRPASTTATKQTVTPTTASPRLAQGGRRLSRACRGRLRLGETLQRAHVPPLPEDFGLHARVARFHNVYGP